MKKFFIIFTACNSFAMAQVGINTLTPQKTLDIEGDLRLKTVTNKSADAAYTNVLVQNPTTGFVDAVPKSSLTPVNTEPWYVQNSSIQATSNVQNIYQNANVGIGNFSGASATERLDINGNARVRALIDASAAPTTYSRSVVADANGVLAYKTNNYTIMNYSAAIDAGYINTGVSLTTHYPVVLSAYASDNDVPAVYWASISGGTWWIDFRAPVNDSRICTIQVIWIAK